MPNCMEQVYSEEYYDFLIPYGVEAEVPSTPGCVQRIAEDYDIFFYPREGLPPLSIGNYTYTAIPKCYALLDTTALDASGITRLQNQPVLALKGEGVLVGVIDTGVDYTNPLFRYSDGSSRILRIWDQTIQERRRRESCTVQSTAKRRLMKHCKKNSRMMWCRPAMKTGTGRS